MPGGRKAHPGTFSRYSGVSEPARARVRLDQRPALRPAPAPLQHPAPRGVAKPQASLPPFHTQLKAGQSRHCSQVSQCWLQKHRRSGDLVRCMSCPRTREPVADLCGDPAAVGGLPTEAGRAHRRPDCQEAAGQHGGRHRRLLVWPGSRARTQRRQAIQPHPEVAGSRLPPGLGCCCLAYTAGAIWLDRTRRRLVTELALVCSRSPT